MKVKILLWMTEPSLPVVAVINKPHRFRLKVQMLLLKGNRWHRTANKGACHRVGELEIDPIVDTHLLRVYLLYPEW